MYNEVIKFSFIVSMIFCFCCCYEEKQVIKEDFLRNIEIHIPMDSLIKLSPKCRLPDYMSNEECPNLRYIIYYDSLMCSSCQLHRMGIWRSIIKHANSINKNKVNFLFVFNPKREDVLDFVEEFYSKKIMLDIYVDSCGVLESLNPIIQKNRTFHALLLNENYRIEAIGNPELNVRIEKKFYDFIEDYEKPQIHKFEER